MIFSTALLFYQDLPNHRPLHEKWPKDSERAAKLLLTAAEQGLADAQFGLGSMLYRGPARPPQKRGGFRIGAGPFVSARVATAVPCRPASLPADPSESGYSVGLTQAGPHSSGDESHQDNKQKVFKLLDSIRTRCEISHAVFHV